MKTLKKLQITAILLFVTIIILASFFGIYKKEDFRTVNVVKNYNLGMQFTNSVIFTGNVVKEEQEVIYDSEGNIVENDGETEYSEENGYTKEVIELENEDATEQNYKLSKTIIEKRLKGLNIGEYNIKLNKTTGEIKVEVQENDNVNEIHEHIEQKGEFSIVDKDTQEVLIDGSQVKSSKVVYGASGEDATTTVVYLQVIFNKEGAKKLEEISQIYVEAKTEEQNEDGETEEVDNTKYVSVLIDGQTLSSTYFGEKMATGVLYVPITQANNSESLREQVLEVNNISTVINNGKMPLEYEFEQDVVEPHISKNNIVLAITIPASIFLIACIVLIIKFKIKGLVSTFLQIGYIALLLLAIRYFNVIVTIPSLVGLLIFVIINYVFNYILLNNLKKESKISWKLVGKFALYTVLIYIFAVVTSFNHLTKINSLGMSLVWGSFCLYIYNLTITKAVLEMLNK